MAKKNRHIGLVERILNVVKKNWYLFVIAVLGVVIFGITYVHGGKLSGLVDSLGVLSANYRKQVKSIDRLSEKKAAADKKALEQNKKDLKVLEDKQKEKLDKLENEKVKKIEELKKKKSKELAKKIKQDFKL